MSEFKQYQRKGLSELRSYVKGEDLTNISVAEVDSPETDMGMVARNPKNHRDQWYVAKKYFNDNLELFNNSLGSKTLHNSNISGAHKNVKDIQVVGNGDMFKLLCKASSEKEGWMKSTKAMDIGHGCVVQVTTQQKNPNGSYVVAEALTFVPGVGIKHDINNGRKLYPLASK